MPWCGVSSSYIACYAVMWCVKLLYSMLCRDVMLLHNLWKFFNRLSQIVWKIGFWTAELHNCVHDNSRWTGQQIMTLLCSTSERTFDSPINNIFKNLKSHLIQIFGTVHEKISLRIIYIKRNKNSLRLNHYNFRTITAIDFLFSPLHTTPFLYHIIYIGVLY